MIEYGNLIFTKTDNYTGWLFNGEKMPEGNLAETLKRLGKQKWDLVHVDPQVGFIFKRRRWFKWIMN